MCHLKNSELELKFQKYKGRVVLGCGIVKGESGSSNKIQKSKHRAMKIPDAKAAVDKEWEKLENLLSWQMTKVKSKRRGH